MPVARPHRVRSLARLAAAALLGGPAGALPWGTAAAVLPGWSAVDELVVDGGSEYSPWAGGVHFRGDTDAITATRLSDSLFEIRATSAAASPMGAREIAFTIGSTAYGERLRDGVTYPLYTGGRGSTPPRLFSSAGVPPCADEPGVLAVDVAEFAPDGTPLAFAASFTYCGSVRGHVRWQAGDPVDAPTLTTDRGRLDFGTVETGAQAPPQTVTIRNAGRVDQQLGTARVADYGGEASPNYRIGPDTCSRKVLLPGASCAVTVTATPVRADRRNARLLLEDGSRLGRRSLLLTAGPDRPAPTHLTATPALRAVELAWPRNGSDTEVTGYTVHRGVGAAPPTRYAEVAVDGPQGTFTDRGLAPGTTYRYAVTATNAAGESLPAGAAAAAVRTGVLVATDRWSGAERRDIGVLGATGVLTRLTTGDGDHETPAVSRDATLLAYTSDVGNERGDYDLWVGPIHGPVRRITADAATSDGEPAFAPDGATLAFTRLGRDGPSVWTVPVAGGEAREVPGSAGDSMPAWSPDGRLLAVAHAGARSSIVLTSLDGTGRRALGDTDAGSADAFDPSFSPSGTSVSYVRADDTSSVVAEAPVRGDDPATLRSPPFLTVRSQTWGPGGRLVFEASAAGEGESLWEATIDGAVPVRGSHDGVMAAPAVAEPS